MKLIILDLILYLDCTSAHSKARALCTSTFLPSSQAGFGVVQAGLLLYVSDLLGFTDLWVQESRV